MIVIDLPPHHEADPLHILQVQWSCIRLRFPPISRLEVLERNDDLFLGVSVALCASFEYKVILPAHGTLLSPIGSFGQDLIFEGDGVLFAIGPSHVQDERGICRQVPGGAVIDGPLGCETGATKSLDVERA